MLTQTQCKPRSHGCHEWSTRPVVITILTWKLFCFARFSKVGTYRHYVRKITVARPRGTLVDWLSLEKCPPLNQLAIHIIEGYSILHSIAKDPGMPKQEKCQLIGIREVTQMRVSRTWLRNSFSTQIWYPNYVSVAEILCILYCSRKYFIVTLPFKLSTYFS